MGGQTDLVFLIQVAQDRNKWRAVLNKSVNSLASIKTGNLFIEQQLAYRERFWFSHSGIYDDMIYIDGRIILRWIFRKLEGVVGTGWSWLRIGTGCGRLWVR